jgi:hypothetical protein
MLGIDELLVFKVESAADWRRRLALEHPDDAERNLAAAESLTRIAQGLRALEGGALHRRADALLTDPSNLERPFDEIIRQATNAVGFRRPPESADEFLRELIHDFEREVSRFEAVGVGDIGSLSAHGEVSNPSPSLLAAMQRPTWPQEKADFLLAMREGKNLYDELHAIFGAKREKEPSDNRAGDRDDFLSQVNADRNLMASTAEVMQSELAQETVVDARRARLSGNVFAALREGAKAMGKFFGEGLFKELGKDAATRAPALLVQIQEKMHYLHQIVSSWLY